MLCRRLHQYKSARVSKLGGISDIRSISSLLLARMATTDHLDNYVFEGTPEENKNARLEDFKQHLNNELARSFPVSLRPHDDVHVLLLCWKEADSDNINDVRNFQSYLKAHFNFNSCTFEIGGPGRNPEKKIFNAELQRFKQESNENTLSILYYTGHGHSNASKRSNSEDRKDLVIL